MAQLFLLDDVKADRLRREGWGGARHHRLAQCPQHHRDVLTDEVDRHRRKLL